MNWKHTTTALISASALTCALAIDAPKSTWHEGSSSNRAQVATIATSDVAAGMSDYARADRDLADRIVDALNSDNSLQGSKISVLAENGDVTLSGTVKNSRQAEKATDIASKRNTAGRVTSTLIVG